MWIKNTTIRDLEYNYTLSLSKGKEIVGSIIGTVTSHFNGTESVGFVIPNRLKITDGDYDVVVTFKEKKTGYIWNLERAIKIAGVVKVELGEATVSAGGIVGLRFNNQGVGSKTFNVDLGLVDSDGIQISTSSFTLSIAGLGSSSVIFSIPGYAKSGIYNLKIDCRDGFGDILSRAFSMSVSGISTDLDISLNRPAYLPGEEVSATYTITNKAIAFNDGMLKMRVIDMTPPKVAKVDIYYLVTGNDWNGAIRKIYIGFSRGMIFNLYNIDIKFYIKLYAEDKQVSCNYKVEGNGVWLNNDQIVLIPKGKQYKITINGNLSDIYGNRFDGNGNGISEGAPIDNYEEIDTVGKSSLSKSAAYPMKENGEVLWQKDIPAIMAEAGGSITDNVQIGTITTPSKNAILR